MKKLRKIGIWIFSFLYLIIVSGFVSKRFDGQLCNILEISIEDSLNIGFLEKEDIINILEKKQIHYLGVPLNTIDLEAIEKAVYSNQIVRCCKAYVSISGILHIDIEQRKPFVRIMEKRGKSYYLDKEGNVLNLSKRYTSHVLVFNGHIQSMIRVGQPLNVNQLELNSANRQIKEVFELASFIDAHTLWKSQFVQVYVNEKGEYELVPRIGPHIILLGTIDQYKVKLDKLEVFYKEGLNNVGWNQYLNINLKYKDQVVCTKI